MSEVTTGQTAGVMSSPAVCPLDCPDTCSLTVTHQDGVIQEVRGSIVEPVYGRAYLHQGGTLLPGIYPRRQSHPVPVEARGAPWKRAVRTHFLGRGVAAGACGFATCH